MLKAHKILFLILIISFNENYFAQVNLNENQFRLAKMYEAQDDLVKAKQIYQNLYNQQPTNIEYYFALNDLFLKLKDYNSSWFVSPIAFQGNGRAVFLQYMHSSSKGP